MNEVATFNATGMAEASIDTMPHSIEAEQQLLGAILTNKVTSGANSVAQRATITAVDADPSVLKHMVDAFHSRRDLVVGLIKEIPGMKINVPDGAFYVFPDVSSFFGKTLRGTEIKDANDFSMYLLAEANVATVTGDAFGNPNCIRFSYATSDDILKEALRRIKEAVS